MLVHRLDDPAAFLGEASPLLLQDEARHNLLLGLAATLRDHPSLYPEHRLWRVRADGGVVGAASRTPPQNFVLARPRLAGAVEALAAAIDADLPGVTGAVPEVEAFAAAWGAAVAQVRREGIHAVARVRPVPPAPGAMRDATAADRSLLLDWWRAFALEALGVEPPRRTSRARSTTVSRAAAREPCCGSAATGRSRSPPSAARRRTGSGSARSPRRRRSAAVASRPLSSPRSRHGFSPQDGASASSTPTSRTRRRTGSTADRL